MPRTVLRTDHVAKTRDWYFHIAISKSLLKLIQHNTDSIYFLRLIDMFGANNFKAKDYIILKHSLCLSLIDQKKHIIKAKICLQVQC